MIQYRGGVAVPQDASRLVDDDSIGDSARVDWIMRHHDYRYAETLPYLSDELPKFCLEWQIEG